MFCTAAGAIYESLVGTYPRLIQTIAWTGNGTVVIYEEFLK